jgi:hypothetical protein
MLAPRLALTCLLANLIGIALFLGLASQYWVEPRLMSESDPIIAEAISWFLAIFPLLGLYALGNLIWFLLALCTEPLGRWWQVLLFMAGILGCWALAFAVDHAHHGI